MFNVGDRVIVMPPFAEFFPGVWEIEGVNPDTGAYQIAGGIDFDAIHLSLAEE